MSLFKINDYESALTLTSERGEAVVRPVKLVPGAVQVIVNPISWLPEDAGLVAGRNLPTTQLVPVTLRLPLVEEQRFDGDGGLYGSVVWWPATVERSLPGARRFCHPRLDCPLAQRLAAQAAEPGGLRKVRDTLRRYPDFRLFTEEQSGFTWTSWFGRVHKALWDAVLKMEKSRQSPHWKYLRNTLQDAIQELMGGSEEEDDPTLPTTNPVLLLRHQFEIELNYPEPLDTRLYDALKGQFLQAADMACAITATGKGKVGRQVARIPPEGIESHITGRGIPHFQIACSAMEPWANPLRDDRENRGHFLPMRNPAPSKLSLPGIRVPPELARCMTIGLCAAIDLVDLNLFFATGTEMDDPLLVQRKLKLGQETSGDIMLVTPAGAEQFGALLERTRLMKLTEFQDEKKELDQMENLVVDRFDQFVGWLDNNQPVFEQRVQCSYTAPREAGHDKYKLLWGGMKGVGDRIRGLYTRVGDQEMPIHLVVSERDAWKKGARVMFAGMMATMAGLTELNPAWNWDELLDTIQAALKERGLDEEGRFPVYAKRTEWRHQGQRITAQQADDLRQLGVKPGPWARRVEEPLCHAVVGWVPVVRATETEVQQKRTVAGLSMSPHMRNLLGIRVPPLPEAEAEIAEFAGFFNRYENLAPPARR